VLANYFEVAQQVDLNPQPLLRRVGLSKKILAERDHQLSAARVIELLEASAAESGCDTFGLRMAELRKMADFGEISLLFTHQRTLRDVLYTTMQYRHLLNRALALAMEDAGDTVIIREELVTDPPIYSRQAMELAIGVLFRLCGAVMGPHWAPRGVSFMHEPPADLRLHKRMFRCPVGFNREFNGVVCKAADLDAPNPLADPNMASYARRFLDSLPVSQESSVLLEVRKAVYLLLPMERASIEQVAQALGMNVRTLQRRLDEAGDHFSDIINGVRRDLAVRYMSNPRYPLAHIAALLGYSVPSSFTRWFTAQFGMAPQAWRQSKGMKASAGRALIMPR
jgi:AraC-like DNA-binding protein